VNFEPLKPLFLSLFISSRTALTAFPQTPPLLVALHRNANEPQISKRLPALALTLQPLIDRLKNAYKATAGGKFTEALNLFISILQTIPLITVESRQEVNDVITIFLFFSRKKVLIFLCIIIIG
jgi:coatomer protein complex subunit alpha (xenin)